MLIHKQNKKSHECYDLLPSFTRRIQSLPKHYENNTQHERENQGGFLGMHQRQREKPDPKIPTRTTNTEREEEQKKHEDGSAMEARAEIITTSILVTLMTVGHLTIT